jgi:hypothetical protein
MENKLIFELDQQLTNFNIDNNKSDAIIQLKIWQKKMFTLIEKIYLNRLNEIDQLKSNIIVDQIIPENFHHLIERTIRVKRDDDDDDFVIIDKNEDKFGDQVIVVLSAPPTETRVSKIFNSEPVQQVLAVGLAQTLTHMGTIAATSTTTIAATTMAKTALLTTACGLGTIACGMGRMAMGTTKKICSLVVSSDN